MNRKLYALFCATLTVLASCVSQTKQSPLSVIADRGVGEKTVQEAINRLGAVTEPSLFWTEIANDNSYSLERRHACLTQLFRRHVKAGLSLGELAQVIRQPNWLTNCPIQKLLAGTGYCPVKLGEPGSVFMISALPPANWRGMPEIFVRLDADVTKEEFRAVLLNKHVESHVSDAKILEVAIIDYDSQGVPD